MKKTKPAAAATSDAEVRGAGGRPIRLDALLEQAAGLRRAQHLAKLAHVITGPDGSFESWSETLPSLIGVHPDDIVKSTRRWLDLVHPQDRAHFRSQALAARACGEKTEVEYRIWRPDGKWVHVRQVMEPIAGAPSQRRWFNTLQDVTAQKAAEERIGRLNRVYAILSGINSLIVRVRDRGELFQNACDLMIREGNFRMAWIGIVDTAAKRVRRVAAAGDVGDFFHTERLSLVEGSPAFGFTGLALRQLRPAVSQDIQQDPRSVRKDDYAARGIHSVCMLPLVVGGEGVGVIALYAAEIGFFDEEEMRLLLELAGDVAFAIEHIEKSETARYLAYYDSLTGLANRSLFYEHLERSLRTAAREHRRLAVAILDLDRFRTVNDSFGRHTGDALLKEVAARLRQIPDIDSPARMAGDIFAVVIPEGAQEEDLARRVEELFCSLFGLSYRIAETDATLSARGGVAVFPGDAQEADTLVRYAEAALKKAKKLGERHLFYEQRMTERVAERLALESKLRRALENGEFLLHYQPKVNATTRAITGLEALLRWQNPELGLVPPMKFVALLEETGLILEVGSWALRRAALDHKSWLAQGLAAPRIAVNVSAIQLRQRNFVRLIADAVRDGAVPPCVDLEITESLLMEDIEASIEKLKCVRDLGLNLAIDDFGTGYSSLAYLAKLPVQALKIDRSFIASMQDDPDATTLVSTMISLAHSMRLTVVAEGVETEEQAKILRLLKCDEMQGYLFGKPLPGEQLRDLLGAKV